MLDWIGAALSFLKELWPSKKEDGRGNITVSPVIVVRTNTIERRDHIRFDREEISVVDYGRPESATSSYRAPPITVAGDKDGDAVEDLPDQESIAWSASAQMDARMQDDEDAHVSWTFSEGKG